MTDSDNITVLAAPPSELIAKWDVLEAMIESALPCVLRRFLPVDILVMCLTGNAQGWFIREDDELLAVMVTRVDLYPRRKGLSIFALAGRDMNRFFEKANEVISEYARQMGCDFLECQGRRGWERILDLEPRAVFLCKDLSSGATI